VTWYRCAAGAAIVLLAAGCAGSVDDSKPHDQSVFTMKVGQCVVPPTTVKATIAAVRVVPCTQAHTQEVFAIESYHLVGATTTTGPAGGGADAYPGDAALRNFANGACLNDYKGYLGTGYTESSFFYTYLLPSARSWDSGRDRKVVCLVTTTGQQLTTSVKGSRQ
jgi:hypothetical protein